MSTAPAKWNAVQLDRNAEKNRQSTRAQGVALMALNPTMYYRELLLRIVGTKSETIEAAIRRWAPPRKSIAYFGPNSDTNAVRILSQMSKYNHFVHVDSAPGANGFYGASSMSRLWKVMQYNLQAIKIDIEREFHDPVQSRHVFFLRVRPTRNTPRPRPERLVLEYYYDTPFEMIETNPKSKSRSYLRPLLMRKLRAVVGIMSWGAPMPSFRLRNVMPHLEENFGSSTQNLPLERNVQTMKRLASKPQVRALLNAYTTNHMNKSEMRKWAPNPNWKRAKNDLNMYSEKARYKKIDVMFPRNVVMARQNLAPQNHPSGAIRRYMAGLPLLRSSHPVRKRVVGLRSGRNGHNALVPS